MRELICGVVIGLCCGIAIGAWGRAKIQEILDDIEDESDLEE